MIKTFRLLAAAVILSALSVFSFAADPATSPQTTYKVRSHKSVYI